MVRQPSGHLVLCPKVEKLMRGEIPCSEPWCRVLESMLRHGPVELDAEREGHEIKMFIVRWTENPHAGKLTGRGTSILAAINEVYDKARGLI